jgi:2-methylcitrate dehydratase PrpD
VSEEASLTAHVADFVARTTLDDVPDEVRALGAKSLLDGLGLALAGSVAEGSRLLRAHIESLRSSGESSALGTSLRLPARFAALANGTAIHADDYDDTQLAVAPDRVYGLLTHPTAPVLPAVLAVAEAERRSGADLVAAYHVGVEVETKIAEAIAPRHYGDGFHTTATVGCFGAAAAVANLRGCSARSSAVALGIAGSHAAGLREHFGTMTKPLHAGRAAEAGVVAADLAAAGFTASARVLEAPRGFFQAAGGGYDEASIRDRLGAPWTFASPGVSIKPHPSGSLTHPAMHALARLAEEHDVRAEQVERVRVGTSRHLPNALIHHRPRTALEAKFSMEFCAAIVLLERRGGLAEFRDEVVLRPDVQALIERVEFAVDPEAEAAGFDRMATLIEIELRDGRVLRGRADFAAGSPALPMSYDDVAAKFRECADHASWPAHRVEAAIELVARLEDLDDVGELTALLSG